MSAAAKKTVLTVAAIVALNVFFAAWSQYAAADLYKKGSTGATVTEIQTRLKAWGYYTGADRFGFPKSEKHFKLCRQLAERK